MRWIHAADIHLDSPLRGLSRWADGPEETFRCATRVAFRNLVELCRTERADALLLAGDLFDGDLRDHHAAVAFVRQIARVAETGCRVFLVLGNHDAENELLRGSPLPDGVSIFASERPETVVLDDLGLAVHGQSFASPAERRNLAAGFPDPIKGALNIGLLHTNANGSTEHQAYAPCALGDLIQKGYDYWALGHVHRHQILHEEPWVVYPGNLQGRHVRETGPKGACVIDAQPGCGIQVTFRPLDVARFEARVLSLDSVSDEDDLLASVASVARDVERGGEGRPTILRLVLRGSTDLHRTMLRSPERWRQSIERQVSHAPQVFLEKLRFETVEATPGAAAFPSGFLAALQSRFQRVAADPELLHGLRNDVRILERAVGSHDVAPFDDEAWWRERLAGAEARLLNRLDGETAP